MLRDARPPPTHAYPALLTTFVSVQLPSKAQAVPVPSSTEPYPPWLYVAHIVRVARLPWHVWTSHRLHRSHISQLGKVAHYAFDAVLCASTHLPSHLLPAHFCCSIRFPRWRATLHWPYVCLLPHARITQLPLAFTIGDYSHNFPYKYCSTTPIMLRNVWTSPLTRTRSPLGRG